MAVKLKIDKKFALKRADLLRLRDYKESGFKVTVYPSKKYPGAKEAWIENDKDLFIALTCNEFDGDVTLDTILVQGENSLNEPRLYLTNKSDGRIGLQL